MSDTHSPLAAGYGRQLCKRLREAGIHESMLPIIVMSGQPGKDLVEDVRPIIPLLAQPPHCAYLEPPSLVPLKFLARR